MAVVPIVQGNAVAPRPMTDAKFRAADPGPGVGPALAAFGRTGMEVVDDLARQREENARLLAVDAENQLASTISTAIDDPETGYRNRRGREAVETFDQTFDDLREQSIRIGRGLPPDAQFAYNQAVKQRMMAARVVMARHMMDERENWRDEASESRIRIASNDAANNYSDPEESERFIATAVNELRTVGERRAWSPEVLADRTQRTVSSIRRDVAGRLLMVSPDVSEQYLDTFRGQFTSDDAHAAEVAIRSTRNQVAAEQRRIASEQRAEENRRRAEARQAERDRRADLSDAPPGTFVGELTRGVATYKNFGVTLLLDHMRRGMVQKGPMARAGYAANLVISTTLMGALAVQLKEISKGREARPMDTEQFWGAAALQGGGLGIFGDFLFSDVNRYGGSLSETLAGPVFSFLNDVRRLTIGNALEATQGESTNAGREAVGMLGRYTPGGSLWYARLAYQRILLDQLQKEVDPDYQEAFDRMEQRARSETDQGFWWRPGEMAPEAMQ